MVFAIAFATVLPTVAFWAGSYACVQKGCVYMIHTACATSMLPCVRVLMCPRVRDMVQNIGRKQLDTQHEKQTIMLATQ